MYARRSIAADTHTHYIFYVLLRVHVYVCSTYASSYTHVLCTAYLGSALIFANTYAFMTVWFSHLLVYLHASVDAYPHLDLKSLIHTHTHTHTHTHKVKSHTQNFKLHAQNNTGTSFPSWYFAKARDTYLYLHVYIYTKQTVQDLPANSPLRDAITSASMLRFVYFQKQTVVADAFSLLSIGDAVGVCAMHELVP